MTWVFTLAGSYHFQPIVARGVTIDNTLNTLGVTVTIGAYQVTIPAFQRIPVPLPRNAQLMTLQAASGFAIGVEFWVNADLDVISQYALQQAAVATTDWQKITEVAANARASVDLGLPGTFQRFRLTAQGILFSLAASLEVQTSADGGATFFSTNEYQFAGLFSDTTGGTSVPVSLGIGFFPLSGLIAPGVPTSFDATMEFFPGNIGVWPAFSALSWGLGSDGNFRQGRTGGSVNQGVLMNFMRVRPSSGTFSGTLILEGFPT